MTNLQINCHLKTIILKLDHDTGVKQLIHGANQHKENQLQNMKHARRLS